MISMKTNAGRKSSKLPIPAQRAVGDTTVNPLAVVDDLSIPAFLDAKTTPSAKESAMKKQGPLSALASAIKDGNSIDTSGGKAALRAAAAKAVAKTKVPVTKRPAPKKAAMKVKHAPKTKAAPAAKTSEPRTTLYDWSAAEANAKTGTVPPTPPFASYGPHMKKAHDMAKAGQAKELREYLADFNHEEPIPPSRRNLFRYGDLCLQAVKKGA